MSFQTVDVTPQAEDTVFVRDAPKTSSWKIGGALVGAMCIGTVLLSSTSGTHPKHTTEIDTLFSAAMTSPATIARPSTRIGRVRSTRGFQSRPYAQPSHGRTSVQTHASHGHAGRKFFVGGNWKCNGCEEQVNELVGILNKGRTYDDVDIVVCPPAIHLKSVKASLSPLYKVCAQDVSLNDQGAFTGDITADQYMDIGVSHTLVGHSERRTIHGETSEQTALKAKKALASKMQVIACIGETLEERETDKTMEVLFEQLTPFKEMYSADDWKNTVIAYEPVWAIGTGKVATPEQAEDVHKQIREWLSENVSEKVALETRIIYGGSVNEGNAAEIGANFDIDGFLVGGASLKSTFIDIINAAPEDRK